MIVFRSLACRLIGHVPNRARVWHDGLSYRSRCTRCDRPMLRAHLAWILFTSAHYSTRRLPHPKFDREE